MKQRFNELWLCEVCRRWFPTSQIRKVPHDSLQLAGSNYLMDSDPGAATWGTTDTFPAGRTSMGTSGDFRLKVQESTTGTPPLMNTTLLNAAATFHGPGYVWSATAHGFSSLLTFTDICFWIDIGSKEDAPVPLVVEVGTWDSSGPGPNPIRTFNVLAQQRVWFTVKAADIPSLQDDTQVYVGVTCGVDDEWWLQNACLAKNRTTPGVFIPTAGAIIDIAKDTWTRTAVYACPDDADEVLLRRRTPGRRENRMIPPYEERET